MFLTGPDAERFRAEQREATAHHEAGHAVAAVARGGTFTGFSIEATMARDGWVHVIHERRHREFVTFAGPWADARFDWADKPLDGVDDDGHTFLDYLRTSLRVNLSDLNVYEPSIDTAELFLADLFGDGAPEVPVAHDEAWYDELESYWSTMKLVAETALRGNQVTPEYVRELLAARRD